ncbi:hypothetical protein [Streptomyces glaucescens]|uniref:Uncharacterized protein n=1 Tax=Streptomyces glaucescens TaxID=1907 RepID=A0A089X1C6_STRGA|nr:hypothetical protein [Streptomyces glaucescens]AIR97567.1 hypothetical protein SGLAU_07760 [Streptomyces glaucescens]
MHAYDAPRRQPYPSVPPPSRPVPDRSAPSPTPIYDKLYAEYVKSFRALPGDRSGEEKLGFTAFGSIPYGAASPSGSPGGALAGSLGGSYGAYYGAGANSARQSGGQPAQWERVGRIPAALPPARRGSR